jgi:hypothetical protein
MVGEISMQLLAWQKTGWINYIHQNPGGALQKGKKASERIMNGWSEKLRSRSKCFAI